MRQSLSPKWRSSPLYACILVPSAYGPDGCRASAPIRWPWRHPLSRGPPAALPTIGNNYRGHGSKNSNWSDQRPPVQGTSQPGGPWVCFNPWALSLALFHSNYRLMEFLGPTRRPIMCTCNFIWINKSKCRFYELCNSAGLRFIISSRTHKAIQRQQPTPWTRSIGHTCFINGRSLVSLPNVWAECILLKFLRIKNADFTSSQWMEQHAGFVQTKETRYRASNSFGLVVLYSNKQLPRSVIEQITQNFGSFDNIIPKLHI